MSLINQETAERNKSARGKLSAISIFRSQCKCHTFSHICTHLYTCLHILACYLPIFTHFGTNMTHLTSSNTFQHVFTHFTRTMIEERAREIAEELVLKTRQTVQIDNSRQTENDIKKAIQQKTFEISSKMPSNLWD